jgi:hypothetical protein
MDSPHCAQPATCNCITPISPDIIYSLRMCSIVCCIDSMPALILCIWRLADEWENHGKSVLSEIEGHVFHPVNFFLLAKYFAINWPRSINEYVAKSHVDGKIHCSLFDSENKLKWLISRSYCNTHNLEWCIYSFFGLDAWIVAWFGIETVYSNIIQACCADWKWMRSIGSNFV